MEDPATQSPLISSSSAAARQKEAGGCGGAGAASCAAPSAPSSSSSSSSPPLSLFMASPAGSGGLGGGGGGGGVTFIPTPPSSSSSSSSSSSGGLPGVPPPPQPADSPDSPFELVPPPLPFSPPAPPRGVPFALTQIPEDRECHFPPKPPRDVTRDVIANGGDGGGGSPGGGTPLPLPLPRPPPTSATAAALEEVSKCVREMRSFTTELLAWDLQEPRGRDVTDPPHDVTADAGKGGGGGGGVAAASPPPSPPPPPPPPPLPAPPEGDSSGDSDDTVIEELPPPRPERGRDVTSDPAMTSSAASHPSPSPPPRPAGWEGEGGEGGEGAGPQPPPHTPTPPRRLLLPRTEVHDLLYWRDPKKSGVTFGLSLLLLLSLATFSAVTVLAHLALALLSVTISLRVYRAVLQALQKKEEGHPFRAYLALDVTVSPETFREVTATLSQHLTRGLRLLLRLFLVEDLVDSLKLAMAMWLLTYVGAVFNGITLLILAELLAFSLPPLYEKYKVQIDHSLELIRCHTKDLMATLQAKLPGLAKKKAE